MPTYIAYIRIQRDFLSVRIVARRGAGGYYEDVPQFAYHAHSKKEVAFGSAATPYMTMRGYTVAQVFHHPRLAIHDLENTDKVLRYFLMQALPRRTMVRLNFVIHLVEEWEGGITDIEKLALEDISRKQGARAIVLCTGPGELSESEVLDLAREIRGNEFFEAT